MSSHSMVYSNIRLIPRRTCMLVLSILAFLSTPYTHLFADSMTAGESATYHQLYKIGDIGPGGGIVFFVSANGLNGLEATPWDQHSDIRWDNGSFPITNARRDGVNGGAWNAERIIKSQGDGDYAAQVCAQFKGGGQGDWFLPSRKELVLLYLKKDIVGNFAEIDTYWSSTECLGSRSYALVVYFGSGTDYCSEKVEPHRVRCVRAF